MAQILNQLDQASQTCEAKILVIIDELGGQSCLSSKDSIMVNLSYMWSISEYLLSCADVLTVISTHNHLLNNLCTTYLKTTLL